LSSATRDGGPNVGGIIDKNENHRPEADPEARKGRGHDGHGKEPVDDARPLREAESQPADVEAGERAGSGLSRLAEAEATAAQRADTAATLLEEARAALARQKRTISLNTRIANVFLTASPGEIYVDVLEILLDALDCDFGYFGYISEKGDLVCPSMTREVWHQCDVPDKTIAFPPERWGGLWGESLRTKRSLMANGGLKLPEGHVALENALAVPILHRNRLIGQFALANKKGGFQEEDRKILEGAAAQTAPVLHAIREQARETQVRERLEEQYRQAQKMEAVGQLTGGVAHDFNNLLQVINGGTEMAMMDLEAEHPAREALQEVSEAGQRAARLVEKLLLFSRRQTMHPMVLDLNEAVADLLKMLRRVIGETVRLEWHPGDDVGAVHADHSMVEQALMNLCVNARDAMPEGGTLTIETENVMVDEEYCASHSSAVPGRYSLLTVSDTGEGMDRETLGRAFEPFFSTKEIGKGTGLGLATVYGIVKQHGGMINVYSEPGQGTVFKLYWPVVDSAADLGEAPEEDDHDPSWAGGRETILLAEDNALVRRLARAILQRAGYTVVTAGSGTEAVSIAEEEGERLDLAILDVVMPDMGGREAYERIRGRRPNLKALFASGYSPNVVRGEFAVDRSLDLIQKPFGRHDLLRAVRRTLDRPAS
jgi:signal transduction histidine kinase/ActR/RegA family two-component response regulator